MIRTASPQIELRRLHRVFDETHAVNDVSFEVYAGEVFGYIGPNGAGKTTSMRILATLDEPTAGDAFVDGFSVVEKTPRIRSTAWRTASSLTTAAGLRGAASTADLRNSNCRRQR